MGIRLNKQDLTLDSFIININDLEKLQMVWFIWRGYGFLVPVVGLVIGGGIVLTLQSLMPEANFYYLQALGLVVAAVSLWFIGQKLYSGEERTFIDKATGEEFVIKPVHTFYWIKVHHWAFILVAFAFFMLGQGTH